MRIEQERRPQGIASLEPEKKKNEGGQAICERSHSPGEPIIKPPGGTGAIGSEHMPITADPELQSQRAGGDFKQYTVKITAGQQAPLSLCDKRKFKISCSVALQLGRACWPVDTLVT